MKKIVSGTSALRRCFVAALLAVAPTAAAAQEMPHASDAPAATAVTAAGTESRNQVALEIGILSAGVSYARRIGATPWSVGAGAWGAWEPPNTFHHDFFEPIGVTVFGRYRAAPWLHLDGGVIGARYLWADDCSDCSGTFAGVRAVALAGHGLIYVGPELAAGWASDSRNGTEFGIVYGAQVRFVIGWER